MLLAFMNRLSFLGIIFKVIEKEHGVFRCKKYRSVAELKQCKLISFYQYI